MFMGMQLLPVWGLGGSIFFTQWTPRKSRYWPILQYTAAVAGDRAGMGPATRGPLTVSWSLQSTFVNASRTSTRRIPIRVGTWPIPIGWWLNIDWLIQDCDISEASRVSLSAKVKATSATLKNNCSRVNPCCS
jgi:hypothetical protein